MKPMIPIVVFSATVALAAGAAENVPEGDLARLQGRWATRAGPKRDIPVVLEIEGWRVKVGVKTPQGWAFSVRGELRIDEHATPRALDWIKFTGPDGHDFPDIPAIYELDGATLRVCNGGPNNPRPTEFRAGDGILADLLIFERPPADASASAGVDHKGL